MLSIFHTCSAFASFLSPHWFVLNTWGPCVQFLSFSLLAGATSGVLFAATMPPS
jgi:hypothetical protein